MRICLRQASRGNGTIEIARDEDAATIGNTFVMQRVRDIGEFALIEHLIVALSDQVRGLDIIGGQQDDCAYWECPAGTRSLVSSDALVEGVHFRRDWTDWRGLGHKMLAVNLSDLASMGATPTIAIVTLALTGDELVRDLEDLYRGAGELAGIYDVKIVGGDIVRTSGPLTLNVTIFGEQNTLRPPMLRSTANVGDVVMVSGTLGASAAGLRLLTESRLDAASAGLLVAAHNRPSPRVSLGQRLWQQGITCCMDISDGLAGDLPKILTASNTGASIDIDRLPVLPAVRALFPNAWQHLALQGGEDYELLFTLPLADVERIARLAVTVGASVTPIGYITAGTGIEYRRNGHSISLESAGAWDHFLASESESED